MMLQLEAPITIGGTDYSDEIRRLVLRRRRNLVTRPATFGDNTEVQKAAALINEVTIEFFNDVTASTTGVARKIWEAALTDSAELAFTAKFVTAAEGADNPIFSGTMVVTGAELGGEINAYNRQQWTFPVTQAGFVEDVTP